MNSSSDERPSTPAVIIVMGVSGSGKSTVASLLALRLHWEFEDGDWFHPAVNIEKMHKGTPLTDDDRKPWLAAIADWIDQARRRGDHAVIACSALKRRYRDVLIGDRDDVRLVYLKGEEALTARRIATRHEHFMPHEPPAQPVSGAGGTLRRRAAAHDLHRAQAARDRSADRIVAEIA
jgi:gluconokinase